MFFIREYRNRCRIRNDVNRHNKSIRVVVYRTVWSNESSYFLLRVAVVRRSLLPFLLVNCGEVKRLSTLPLLVVGIFKLVVRRVELDCLGGILQVVVLFVMRKIVE